jgi:predicted NBD/HSP70 family sugar kinase
VNSQPPAGAGPHVLRQLNTSAVLAQLRAGGPLRVADLVAATGLSRPAVTRALDALRKDGWVAAADGGGDNRMGRPAVLVRFRAEAGYVVGIDVGPHKVLAMVADLAGTVVQQRRMDTHRLRKGRDLLAGVVRTTNEALAAAGVPRHAVLAAAVGTPGLVDPVTGEVTLAPSIPGWTSIPIAAELREQFACPLHVNNDVNLAVIAERWRGSAADADTLVFLQWGARVGAGIMINGRVHQGAASAAGEIGFLDLAERPERAGKNDAHTMGPFERRVGAAAIIDLAIARAGTHGDAELLALMHRAREDDDAAVLFQAAAAGNRLAAEIIDGIAARFARGLGALCMVLDPDLVVIGGGLSRAGDMLLTVVERHVRRRTLTPPRLVLSALGDTAVALGAVRFALDDAEQRLLRPAGLGVHRGGAA